MVNLYAAFGRHFLKVSIGTGIEYVKESSIKDESFDEVSPFEIDRHTHSSSFNYENRTVLAQQK